MALASCSVDDLGPGGWVRGAAVARDVRGRLAGGGEGVSCVVRSEQGPSSPPFFYGVEDGSSRWAATTAMAGTIEDAAMLRSLALTPLTPLLSLPLPYEELPAWGWLGARDELICVVFGPVGGGSCRRCCLPTCPCLLGWRPAAAITLDRTKHDTFTYCDRQSHPFVGNPIRGRSGGGRCHGLCARVLLCFAFACLPCSPLVPSPLAFSLAFASQDRFCPLPSISTFSTFSSLEIRTRNLRPPVLWVRGVRRTFWIDLWLSFSGCRTVQCV